MSDPEQERKSDNSSNKPPAAKPDPEQARRSDNSLKKPPAAKPKNWKIGKPIGTASPGGSGIQAFVAKHTGIVSRNMGEIQERPSETDTAKEAYALSKKVYHNDLTKPFRPTLFLRLAQETQTDQVLQIDDAAGGVSQLQQQPHHTAAASLQQVQTQTKEEKGVFHKKVHKAKKNKKAGKKKKK